MPASSSMRSSSTAPAPKGRGTLPISSMNFTFCGLPALACATDVGFDELGIYAALLPTRRGRAWIVYNDAGFHAGEAFAVGWLERRAGKWLQSSGPTLSCRKRLLDLVANAVIEPVGYGDHG